MTGRRTLPGLAARLSTASAGIALLALAAAGASLPLVAAAPTLAAAAGIALLVLAAGLGTRFRTAGAWAAAAVLGQAAALQLVRAGNSVSYQHIRLPPDPGAPDVGVAAAIVSLQTLAVVVLVVRNGPAVRDRLAADLGGWRLAVVGGAFVLTSATLSPTAPAWAAELAVAGAVQAVNAATLAAAVTALPDDVARRLARRARRWLGREDGDGRPRLLLPAGAALWIVGVAALLAVAAYQRHPHIPDEVVYLLQARYLAEGQLSLPVPPVPEAFELDLMFLDGGRWYSPVPPGWPAVLALGVLVGTPWLVNPLLAGASALLAHRLLRELYDGVTAAVGVALLAVSPWFLFLAMSAMTHAALLAAALLGAVAVARLRETRRPGWAVLGGIAAGATTLVRPLDGLIVGLVLGLWTLTVRGRSWRFAPAAVYGLAAAAVAALVLPYNLHFTGDPTAFPIMEYTSAHYGAGSNALGFGPDRGLGWGGFDPFPGHDLLDALINTNLNAFALNVELFGWSAGSLLPVLLLATSRRLRKTDLAMLGVIGLVVAVYGLYWFSGGPDFGPRYWSLILFPCVALTARAVPVVGRLLRPRADGPGGEDGAAPVGARRGIVRGVLVTGLAAFAATATFVPWRAVDKYHHFRGMRPDVRAMAERRGFGDDALVLVRGERWPDYSSAAVYNPLDLRAPEPVYAWDRGPEVRREVLAAYPDRTVWVVEGPTLTGDGYRVVGRLERGGDPR